MGHAVLFREVIEVYEVTDAGLVTQASFIVLVSKLDFLAWNKDGIKEWIIYSLPWSQVFFGVLGS